jgi:hypothetical protein
MTHGGYATLEIHFPLTLKFLLLPAKKMVEKMNKKLNYQHIGLHMFPYG